MSKIEINKLLFDIACTSIACDGHIDERELDELKRIQKSTPYFKNIDTTGKLNKFIDNFKNNSAELIDNILIELQNSSLNPVQQLLVLEVVLRIVYSDTIIQPNEIEFIKAVRASLTIEDQLIKERFGEIDFLFKTENGSDFGKEEKEEVSQLKSIDTSNLENLYVSLKKDKPE